ncbi:MAG: extracellular solute-binding protein [Candidatus Omnitrophica bacterium]|nr:extracellular solute-binding protein [Candidatus Omnitrophota bacterium]
MFKLVSKQIIIGLLIIYLSSLSFLGCSPAKTSLPSSGVTVVVWHWMTDRQPAFEELAQRYERQTGTRVKFELYAPSEAYSQKVRAAAQGENLPDIFGILASKKDFASFIKAGHVLDLTPYMEENSGFWRKSFFENALKTNVFVQDDAYGVKPGIYGVPIDTMVIQMLYNKKLYAELGFQANNPPATFQELLQVGQKLKGKDLQGFVSGWGEYWMLDCFANNYAFNIMGKDKVLATIRGEIPYTDPDWIKVFSLFKELTDAGLVSSGTITMVNKTAEQLFANERAVFAFNGSWCVNVYRSMNPQLDYGAFMPPPISDVYPMAIWGGAGSSFMVNARSKNKEEAVRFLQWLTQKEQQVFLAKHTHNLPANQQAMQDISGVLSEFAKNMPFVTHPNIWGISEFSSVIETFDRGLQSIILGQKSPQQVAYEVQKAKEKELARKKAQ